MLHTPCLLRPCSLSSPDAPGRCGEEQGVCEGARPCTTAPAGLSASEPHSSLACVPRLSVSYRHNCFNFQLHFSAQMGAPSQLEIKQGTDALLKVCCPPLHPNVSGQIPSPFKEKVKVPMHVVQINEHQRNVQPIIYIQTISLSVLSQQGHLAWCAVPLPCTCCSQRPCQPQLFLLLVPTWNSSIPPLVAGLPVCPGDRNLFFKGRDCFVFRNFIFII